MAKKRALRGQLVFLVAIVSGCVERPSISTSEFPIANGFWATAPAGRGVNLTSLGRKRDRSFALHGGRRVAAIGALRAVEAESGLELLTAANQSLLTIRLGEHLRDLEGASARTATHANTLQTLKQSDTYTVIEHIELAESSAAITWVLSAPPKSSSGSDVYFSIDLPGSALIQQQPQGVAFRTGQGTVSIGNALAVDSTGQKVPLAATVVGSEVRFNAPLGLLSALKYPVAIDPVVDFSGLVAPPYLNPETTAESLSAAAGDREILVTWADWRTGDSVAYAARVAPHGAVIDTTLTTYLMIKL